MIASFAASQNYGNITVITLTDDSTAPDGALTDRLVYIQKADGTYLVPDGTDTDFVEWPIADNTIEIDCLDKDYALSISVKWVTGSTISYTKTTLCLFKAYSELFLRQLTQRQAANPKLIDVKSYWYNKMKLRTLVDDAEQAVDLLNDQTVAQYALDEAKKLTDNVSTFF